MEADRWRQIDSVFEAALDLDPEEWAAYLKEACADDEELHREVESLLLAHMRAAGFIEESPFAVAAELLEPNKISTLIGSQVGRYQITGLLGSGGMGDVYLANDTQLNRPVALKLLPAPFTSDKERLHRFEREARSASALNHPNILTIYEIGQEGSVRFIATEFIEGETLRERIKRARLSLREAVDVVMQVASALAAAHQAGIIHRDIKPENIMLRRDGYIKVLDFGLAKLTGGNREGARTGTEHVVASTGYKTSPGRVMGTVHYMSPEQARGLTVDVRTDIWSLGVVLYELLTGRAPFTGETDSDVMAKLLEREPRPLSHLIPSIPVELERIIARSLCKEKQGRYQSVEQLGADLKSISRRLEVDDSLARVQLGEASQRSDAAGASKAGREARQNSNFITRPLPRASQIVTPNNLSSVSLPLIGRETEIAEIENLLLRSDVRLLTLTGVGGTGKTRLARQVAHHLLDAFTDGVFFIELAAVTNAELVASTILQPLGAQQSGGVTPLETLKNHLREKQMLLVLDNFEQVLAASNLVADLLATSTNLKILVTSRALLRLNIEREFKVTPLALPQSGERREADELMNYGAIALFMERARAAKPAFALSEENAPLVLEICRKLDGLPLAIELAAARIKLLSMRAILSRLGSSLNLLTGGERDLPARQQTMRGAISWSYDLLEREERTLLNRLSVFAGGYTIEAAEAICGKLNESITGASPGRQQNLAAAPDSEIENDHSGAQALAMSVLDGVASLLDKSLLVQKEKPDGESRFRLLEVVREFALERLKESGEAAVAQKRHAEFFLLLSEEAEPHLLGARQKELLDRLEEEHDNLRAALGWLAEHDAAAYARLAGSLCDFWQIREHFAEGRAWLLPALEKTRGETTLTRAKALHAASSVTWPTGDVESARKLLEECLAISKQIDNKFLIIRASNGLGVAAWQQDNLALARPFFEEALSVSRELGDARMIGVGLGNLGATAFGLGDYATARALHEESLAAAMKAGNKQSAAVTLTNLGEVAFVEGDLEGSRNYYAKALMQARELSNWRTIATSLDGLATVAAKTEAWKRAAQLAGAADALRETIKFELTRSNRTAREEFLASVRRKLGEAAFAQAEAEGKTMPLDQVIALSLRS